MKQIIRGDITIATSDDVLTIILLREKLLRYNRNVP